MSKISKKELYPIAKKLGIKYLTWMNKKELIEEINRVENGGEVKKSQKYMCEHNKQKYKCILCDGLHICEHKKQRPACKVCRGRRLQETWSRGKTNDPCLEIE